MLLSLLKENTLNSYKITVEKFFSSKSNFIRTGNNKEWAVNKLRKELEQDCNYKLDTMKAIKIRGW